MEKKFAIGQRVEVTNNYDCAEVGMRGVIVHIDCSGRLGIKFDKKFVGGHTCCGKCPEGYGHYVDESPLKLIDSTSTKYNIGDEVTVKSDLSCGKS